MPAPPRTSQTIAGPESDAPRENGRINPMTARPMSMTQASVCTGPSPRAAREAPSEPIAQISAALSPPKTAAIEARPAQVAAGNKTIFIASSRFAGSSAWLRLLERQPVGDEAFEWQPPTLRSSKPTTGLLRSDTFFDARAEYQRTGQWPLRHLTSTASAT